MATIDNKGFSPCAIIAAYPAEQAAPKTASPISLSKEAYPDRYMKIQEMGYAGNDLLRSLLKRTGIHPTLKKKEAAVIKKPTIPHPIIGKKQYF